MIWLLFIEHWLGARNNFRCFPSITSYFSGILQQPHGTSNREGRRESNYLSCVPVSCEGRISTIFTKVYHQPGQGIVQRKPTTAFHFIAKVNGEIIAHISGQLFYNFQFLWNTVISVTSQDLQNSFSFQKQWKYKDNSFTLIFCVREGNYDSFLNIPLNLRSLC